MFKLPSYCNTKGHSEYALAHVLSKHCRRVSCARTGHWTNIDSINLAGWGAWCSGITSASHAEGPGFKSQCVHLFVGHPTGAALTDASSVGQSVALPLASYSVRQVKEV